MIERRIRDVFIPRAPTISSETLVTEVAQLLCRPGVSAVVVIENDAVDGILTRSDIVSMVAETSATLDAESVMSSPVTTVSPDTTLTEAADTMREHGFTHLPIVEETEYLGVISAKTLAPYLSRHRLDIEPVDEPPRVERTGVSEMTSHV